MKWKGAFLTSVLLHSAIFIFLLCGIKWSFRTSAASLKPIEAHLVIKKKNKNKELLPRKVKAPISEPDEIDQKKTEEKTEALPIAQKLDAPKENTNPALPTLKNESEKKSESKAQKAAKKSSKYVNKLSSLSQAFAKELATKETVEPEGELEDDSSYFDQIYTLIKESFVVPPHLDGPKGRDLQAVFENFLASDGSLTKLDLEMPSGDEHFDKAVLDGTKRVNNFGAVPLFLQNVLRERGIVVELCPVKCKDR